MKSLFTLSLIAIISMTSYAQDKIYVHTATAANTSAHITYIDHPDLDNNPNANIVYKHVWNPNGNSGVYNDNIDGLWYSGSKWAIYNEDTSPMVIGAQFFIYIGSNSNDFITHIASVANEHPGGPFYTVIDDPDFNNNNPGPFAIMSNYYNPNSVYNPLNYGFWYDSDTTNRRVIFTEDVNNIPTDAAFTILKDGSGNGVITRFTAESTAANIANNWFEINNAILNGNPNATFVFQHYWGVNGSSSQTTIDKVLSAWYTGNRWAIYTEDSSPMPEGVAVDIIVAEQEVLGVNENELTTNISIFPNPANALLNIASNANITEVSIYNILGQEILHLNNDQIDKNTIDVSNLTTGNYLLKVQSNKNVQTLKFIKN